MSVGPEVESHLPLTPTALEILLAVGGGARYGYEVMLAVERRTEGAVSPNPGTLYRALDRLVSRGLLDCDTRREQGQERRYLALSALGAAVLRAEAERLAGQVKAARATVGGDPDVSP